ncbi:MAG: hypothetical protein EAZ27_13900, partial [Cytophagales bacterium]
MKVVSIAFLFFTHFLSFAQWQTPNNTNTVSLNNQNVSRNVGIGTTNAAAKLHVVGNTWLNGITSMAGMVYQANAITFTGAKLDFFTPVQAQYNGGKPVLSLSQFGEINFFSSPYLNENAFYLGWTGDFNHGIRQSNNFGGASGFDGPVVFGQNGGALGSSTQNQNWTTNGTKVALSWNNDNVVKIHKSLQFADGTFQTTAGQNVSYNAANNHYTYQGNVNIPGVLKLGTNSLFLGSNTLGNVGTQNYIYATETDLEIYNSMGGTGNTIGDIRLQKTNNRAVKIGGGIAGNITNNSIIQLEVFSSARIHGTIETSDVCVTPNAFCDYVFDADYKLKDLVEVEKFIKEFHHLPEIPSEKEVIKNGLQLNKILLLQMKKIEELTLYLIEQDKKIKRIEKSSK